MTEAEGQRYYNISEVCRKLKVQESTLRYYEKEFDNYLVIRRSAGGRRQYTDTNIEQFKLLIRILKQEKLSIAEAKERLNEMITKNRVEVTPKPPAPPMPEIDGPGHDELKENFDYATKSDVAEIMQRLNDCIALQQQVMEYVGRVGNSTRDLKHLLDMNLQRYNIISAKLQNKNN